MLNVLENLQKFSELYLYDALNLLSCMTLNGKNIQFIFLHYKYKLSTVLNCPRNFGNAVKDGLKRTSHWGAHYFTNPNSWYPVLVLERAMILSVIPTI